MPVQVLATKLFIPTLRPKVVLRPRLVERLNDGLLLGRGFGRKLTLVSAPAGFGKTTLVSEWIATIPQKIKIGWFSVDERDSDPSQFLTVLISALQTISPKTGEDLLVSLQVQPPPPVNTLLTTLLNDMTAIPDPFILVLDDYHTIDSEPIDQALTFLLDNLPPQMHVVIATREDPCLPLPRYRARDQLNELRAGDLRFTTTEAAEFLNQVMHLNLSPDDIAALEKRTEGWITGLQLAALSMQSRQDTAGFIQSFTGSHRFVLDYLVEEVLQRQSEPVRSFLLQTSILERLCGPLCNALTGQEDGKAMLDSLERGNLFVIPLDDRGQWYRYHHLFADVLRDHLRETQSERVSTLHQRASVWFEQNDLPADAIRHALAAKDFERAAELIERVWLAMDLNYQSATWLGWAKALPDELIRVRPVLSLGYAWALLNGGELETSEARLQDAERWLEPAAGQSGDPSARMVVVDEAEFRSLPASIAGARAYRALALGDISGTIQYARQTLALAREDDSVRRTQATALLGMAEYASGNLQAAEQEFLKFQSMMWQKGDIANAISITFILADIMLVQGRLQNAVSAYRQVLTLAANKGASSLLGTCDLYRGLGELLCEQGDLEGAAQVLETARQVGEQGALTGWPQRLCVAQARMRETQDDLAGALVLLDEAERKYVRNPLPDRPIAALKVRTWARQNRLTKALAWVREQNLSPDDELSYPGEFEHLTLARVLIARAKTDRVDGDLHAALGLLARLLQGAEEGGRNGSVIEISILQALAHQAQGDPMGALDALERALRLAEPEGYVRTFLDEGEPVRLLMVDCRLQIEKRLLSSRSASDERLLTYLDRLLASDPVGEKINRPSQSKARNQQPLPHRRCGSTILPEPLSERELQVLKLLRTELSGPEIAGQLVVSLNTLRTHTKNIFGKLGVNNRRAAVRRAEELGLF
jgi:LuxR family maltose regulon positive regulatory protein